MPARYTNIQVVGGITKALEIVEYHGKYFKNYQYYNVENRCFCKLKNENLKQVYMNFLIGEVRKYAKENNHS